MKADGTNVKQVGNAVAKPFFSKDGKTIYFQRGNTLFKMNRSGFEVEQVINSTYAMNYCISPDNNWVAFNDLHKVYVAAFPQSGKTLDLGAGTNTIPVAQFAKDAGINLHWSGDSKTLRWTLGDEYFSKPLNERFLFLPEAKDSLENLPLHGLPVNLTIKTDKPTATYVLNNARIITVDASDKVIEKGYIVVKENKIAEVGEVWRFVAYIGRTLPQSDLDGLRTAVQRLEDKFQEFTTTNQ